MYIWIINIQYWSVNGKYRIYLTRLRNGVKDEFLASLSPRFAASQIDSIFTVNRPILYLSCNPRCPNVALHRRNILIPIQPVFPHIPWWCVLNGKAAYTNCIVLVLTWPGLEITINHTRHEHATHYTTKLPQLIRPIDLIYSQYTYIVGKNKIYLYEL
jgi:hypothetical protein